MSTRKFWTFFGGMFFGTGLIVLLVGIYATYRAYGDAERLAQEGQIDCRSSKTRLRGSNNSV